MSCEYPGYGGSILFVDLSTKETKTKPITREMIENYIGGEGFALALAKDHMPAGVDAFSPDNPIIIGAPALGGTRAPPSGKVTWVTKTPIVDHEGKSFIASAKAGSNLFGAMMKNAGYDAIVIKGKAEKPSYLKIIDDDVEICDASEIWGKDVEYTTIWLKRKYGMNAGVAAIGIAGERKIRWSLAFQDNRGSIGRHGYGAVFGAKNLKAICVLGTKGISVAEPEKFNKKAFEMFKAMRDSPYAPMFWGCGYSAFMFMWQITLSQGNWMTHDYGYRYDSKVCVEKIVERTMSCECCPWGCKCVNIVPSGPAKGMKSLGIHSLQVAMLAERLEIDDLAEAVRLSCEYQKAGLCGMTFMSIIDWITRLYKEGKIKKEDVGMELKRDPETYRKLLNMIVNREGLGDVLAEGYATTSKKLGVDVREDKVIRGIAKGHDPIYDARMTTLDPLRFLYLVCPRPAHHGYHDITTIPSCVPHLPVPLEAIKQSYSKGAVTKEELEKAFTPVPYYGAGFDVALLAIINEHNGTLYNCWGTCSVHPVLGFNYVKDINELWGYASGIKKTIPEVRKCAERIYNIYRALNAREGFTRKDDWVEAWMTPRQTPEGPVPLMDYYRTRIITREDLNKLLDDYYRARGWDVEKGVPTEKKLVELGLEDLAKDLKSRGIIS